MPKQPRRIHAHEPRPHPIARNSLTGPGQLTTTTRSGRPDRPDRHYQHSEKQPDGLSAPGSESLGESGGDDVFDLRVFDQAEVWVTRTGERLSIAHMDDQEASELVAFLSEHVNHFYIEMLRRYVLATLLDSLAVERPDRLSRVRQHREPTDQTPEEWLTSTALMRALLRRLRRG